MIPYSHQVIGEDDLRAVAKALRSDWLTQGPEVLRFEKALAKYSGARYAVAFSHGTAALHAAFFAAGLKRGDEFITTPLTFAATANAGVWQGAKPIFADVEWDTGNINPHEVEKKISNLPRSRRGKLKAIVAVDYSGVPVRLDEFKKMAHKHNLIFIEDAAHALGATYKGKKIGALADMTMFSFHPVKSITTGEGGAILTNNKEWYEKMLLFRNHGITKNPKLLKKKNQGKWYYEMQALGLNYRMTDMQASLGFSQLKKLTKFISARRVVAKRYMQAFRNEKNIILPYEASYGRSAWHLFPIRLVNPKKRPFVFKKLQEAGIGAQVHYIPVYLHPYYKKLGYKKGLCPNAERFYASEISIPIFPSLSIKEQNYIIKKIKELFE
ncbi:MAG: UDP-4-amino-4,6-dideoxy-N-acetyl-beta-L-altrosamine transaminase [bacterium]|nr:UDP-4-amino-4,6-dideoxy-N-acetyl-beta-L-altrosamine transaminase [bacterium]